MKNNLKALFYASLYPILKISRTFPAGAGKSLDATKIILVGKSIGFLLLFLVFFSKAKAQSTTSFFYSTSITTNNLSTSQGYRLQKLLDLPFVKSIQLVQVNNLFPLLNNNQLPIALPNTTKTYTFKTNYIRTFPNGDYTWFGELSPAEICTNDTIELL